MAADDTLPNTVIAKVVQFAPDPRGLWMFAALTGRTRRELNNAPAVIDARGSGTFSGLLANPQRFKGLAGRLGGQQRLTAPRTNTLTNERSTDNSTALDAFYDQLRRRQV
jgi:hypothetical protein